MTPGGRAQAAIELLDAIIIAARDQGPAADTLIARYFAERRYAGSKDRRAVRDLVYAAIRRAGERPESGRAALIGVADDDPALAASFTGEGHAPAPIAADEARAAAAVAPGWLIQQLRASGLGDEELAALGERAPLDVRVNRLKADRASVMASIPDAVALPHAADGLRLPAGTTVEQLDAFRAGRIEVQDEGSQIVAMAAAAKPGMAVVDLCAGAGGKTLALGAAMAGKGHLLACDVDRARLARLAPRAERAGLAIVETRLMNPGREADALADWQSRADVVLVDAPCSGTGTWRRNPEARWRLSPDRIARLADTQRRLLTLAAGLVKPGGALIHIVCSLLDAEGAGQIARFLDEHPGWRAEPLALPAGRPHERGVRLTPAHDGTDGFFVARLVRPC
ncbi:RsmB/NOP family class I SAM-dependent RNA methyltransferase [Hephaestia mangrovi]|uniref:RsmB/NOP family class I SAM-dependent RNA methyltransferase n=1 Tax=Hephaestia mangrovi TaxID=2873268 RepID=UPI001CA7659C|nr:RsmB/NOP family class I SAM-dependent RNA methyltransferase [Hephaestia mangrovi]MBY8827856.1 RsmB/NOP family class I SAM-dependent RNA methyltransferase [Hephaestia mangrovi]